MIQTSIYVEDKVGYLIENRKKVYLISVFIIEVNKWDRKIKSMMKN
jgi:hypothetical protein